MEYSRRPTKSIPKENQLKILNKMYQTYLVSTTHGKQRTVYSVESISWIMISNRRISSQDIDPVLQKYSGICSRRVTGPLRGGVWRLRSPSAPVRCGGNFKIVFFKLIFRTDTLVISCEVDLRWIPQNPTDCKSTSVQVIAWCHPAASHYIKQRWAKFMPRMASRGLNRVKIARESLLF